jgi:hypothetical protein
MSMSLENGDNTKVFVVVIKKLSIKFTAVRYSNVTVLGRRE